MTCSRSIIAVAALLGVALPAAAQEARYTCADGARLTAIFTGGAAGGAATLAFQGAGGTTILPQAPSADGGRYADGTTEFWIKGRGATLTRGGRSTTCAAAG